MNTRDPADDTEESTVFLDIPGKAGRTVKPGDVLGDNYRLISLICRGGMGFVYRCKHEIIGRQYALKILHPSKVNEQTWQRFQVEGKAIAKLDHPNIVKIFNMGVDGEDCPYYVMDLLDGDSLEAVIDNEGPLPLTRALEIFAQLVEGLGYAHAKGIIHRDIKPSNMILQQEGNRQVVKIVDFGLAKLVDRKSREEQGLTEAGEVFGSPFYMSPEQAMGGEIDERSDIYSVGCSLYKTLTGNPPFRGENSFQTMMMHQSSPIPSLAAGADGNEFLGAVEDFVAKMMAKKPKDRYQSMAQLSHDLNRLLQGKSISKTAISSGTGDDINAVDYEDGDGSERGHGRKPAANPMTILAAGALAVIALGAGTAYYFSTHKSTKETSTANATIHPADFVPSHKKLMSSQAFSKDESEKPPVDTPMENAKISYEKFQPIPPKPIKKNGKDYVELQFPTPSVGRFTSIDCDETKAEGTVKARAHQERFLEVQSMAHRFTFAYPWILEKLRILGITGLCIMAESYLEVLPGVPGEKTNEEDSVYALLNAARSWPTLREIDIDNITPSARILHLIDTFPNLHQLELKNTDNNGSELASYAFMHKLSHVGLVGIKNIDGALAPLSTSPNLRDLNINRTSPSASALRSLAKCPNLSSLNIEQTDLTDYQLDAIASLPHHDRLNMRETKLTPQQLLRHKFPTVHYLFVSRYQWSNEDVAKLTKAFPAIDLSADHSAITRSKLEP